MGIHVHIPDIQSARGSYGAEAAREASFDACRAVAARQHTRMMFSSASSLKLSTRLRELDTITRVEAAMHAVLQRCTADEA